MKQILVCEDEETIREFIVINLKNHGYTVLEADSGEEALALYAQQANTVAILLLDVMLPGIDGFEVCRQLREHNRHIGIIMLTARARETEKVEAFRLGADDYVTKPFSPSELVARVDALYRRLTPAAVQEDSSTIASGEFALDLRRRVLRKNGKPIELTQIEFCIMEYFLENPGKKIERRELLKYVWGGTYVGDEKVVDVNIHRLRIKIENDPSQPRHLLTVRGIGYQWNS